MVREYPAHVQRTDLIDVELGFGGLHVTIREEHKVSYIIISVGDRSENDRRSISFNRRP